MPKEPMSAKRAASPLRSKMASISEPTRPMRISVSAWTTSQHATVPRSWWTATKRLRRESIAASVVGLAEVAADFGQELLGVDGLDDVVGATALVAGLDALD